MSDDKRPIIIKKIKKHGGGSHGGHWKIAYADFVTAMMAFFLLMWLVGSSSEDRLRGMSEYFQTPLTTLVTGGKGNGGRTSVIQGGGKDLTRRDGQVRKVDYEPGQQTPKPKSAEAEVEGLN